MRGPPSLLLLYLGLIACLDTSPSGEQDQEVFLASPEAQNFLGSRSRIPRANHWDLELFTPGNLERECLEERCSWEEAREYFEDNTLTVRAWGPWSPSILSRPWSVLALNSLLPWVSKIRVGWLGVWNPSVDTLPFRLLYSCPFKERFWEDYIYNGKGGRGRVDIAGLAVGLTCGILLIVLAGLGAFWYLRWRRRRRGQQPCPQEAELVSPLSALSSLGPPTPLPPPPPPPPGLPTYEQALAASGVHDAPPPPYTRYRAGRLPGGGAQRGGACRRRGACVETRTEARRPGVQTRVCRCDIAIAFQVPRATHTQGHAHAEPRLCTRRSSCAHRGALQPRDRVGGIFASVLGGGRLALHPGDWS
ncbi:hypothetical protein HPG69_000439 [Diceros bicornis minor]|uniref:Gla domain-containing protein n=1 Tax=Diceros bicornis minor TaxID=77932 RepID=A0A7J7FDG8_DICBM|nr:hypothetical protein HPG69_000439 [Diceros bicornis minor]